MRPALFRVLVMILAAAAVYAGGEAETGRAQAAQDVQGGQILSIGSVDPASYLEDFAFEKSNTSSSPLLVSVDLSKGKIWDKGEDMSVRIGLVANGQSYFRSVSGSLVLFIQNPELARDPRIVGHLRELVSSEHEITFFIFDASSSNLLKVNGAPSLSDALAAVSRGRKSYDSPALLQRILEAVRTALSGNRNHVLWVTDENIIERTADSAFFHFGVSVLGGGNTTFSYLGYGERPDWAKMNENLSQYNGNSYYADDTEAIMKYITDDVGYFARPAVGEVEISIVWSTFVQELSVFYPAEYYPSIPGFLPRIDNNRPRTAHKIGGMNYGETKRYIHYVHIPSRQEIEEKSNRNPIEGSHFKVGTVYARYHVPMTGETVVQQIDMEIEYQTDAHYKPGDENRYVMADTIIQNTPLVLREVANMVNSSRNYLPAIQLVEAQKHALERMRQVRSDPEIDVDIKMLDGYFTLLFGQAKTMKLLQ